MNCQRCGGQRYTNFMVNREEDGQSIGYVVLCEACWGAFMEWVWKRQAAITEKCYTL